MPVSVHAFWAGRAVIGGVDRAGNFNQRARAEYKDELNIAAAFRLWQVKTTVWPLSLGSNSTCLGLFLITHSLSDCL